MNELKMNESIIKCIEDEINFHLNNCSDEHLQEQKKVWLKFPRDIPIKNIKMIEKNFDKYKVKFLNSTKVEINLIAE